ncbi:MAG: hypothetical protein B7Z42_01470 [Brevundimonas sp. 12-68-7]|uniref:Lysozyme inhibitor LprI N-terminal domain-containing protein n=1 Tax=Brevundimonas subvibrioides TaxID=74313 RepID=A0A258FSX2_9CAUL|nr:MAG: hypothetical protein B7Z42_01470 [Brevundimonas sp. 12-68-7]OYX35054.1 MAG: hypothetical protein B7Z01_04040 [Brevundimonas subvibrioides]
MAAAMVAVAGVGGVATLGAAMAAKRPQGLDACTSASARAGLRDAILTRIAAKGGEVDVGYALSLDTPRLESVDYVAERTVCGGTARWAVPEHRRAALDGVSELSDPVRFMIEPGRGGSGTVVALVGGGDRIADWLGAPPAPPPPPDLLRADYVEGDQASVEGLSSEGTVEAKPEPTVPPPPAVVPTRPTQVAEPRRAARPAEPAPAPRQPIRVATPAAPVARPAAPSRPVTRAPSSTTRQLNTGVSTTNRLNVPVARSEGREANPVPVSSRAPDRPPPPPPSGPSFDCRLSRNAAERTICGDDRLARLDVRMARRYAEAQTGLGPRAAADLRAEQLEWLRRRDDCDSRRCLEIMYDTRAARLDRMN